ncbi:hypothetical protein TIFTF001_050114 [Ficus carica]|uniref:Uncharacterized protein n=1 Tax=Ficus carica TaxID=3494 RepID=A0AA87Z008_FICCA|nr:hypothetical protein TIFTF001_050114 [Ficus carica]
MREAEVSSGGRLGPEEARRSSGVFSEYVGERVPLEKAGDRGGAGPRESAAHGRRFWRKKKGKRGKGGFRWKVGS